MAGPAISALIALSLSFSGSFARVAVQLLFPSRVLSKFDYRLVDESADEIIRGGEGFRNNQSMHLYHMC